MAAFRKMDSLFAIPDGVRRGLPASKATIARSIRTAILEAYRVKHPPEMKAHSTRAVGASSAELHELVLKYREDIISVRTASDHLEEKLKAEILFLKEQIQAEQCQKENIEETLQIEIENCKEEIASISSLKVELDRIKVEKEQLESTLQQKTKELQDIQELKISLEEQLRKETSGKRRCSDTDNDPDRCSVAVWSLESCHTDSSPATNDVGNKGKHRTLASDARKRYKTSLEHLLFEEKNKAQRLQTELDVSEQVQRDFVKLSQTLQVQLERIRQTESLEAIRAILNDTKLTDINQLPET
ncbi:unnamed protein product [Ranitomeya imitator]|uniref:Rabaptin GTPase-Rab5 binding domain-containing protein n=1 Tax=Ranitomeya imitator TaxID=111125 RepID=A0ABN9LMP3_9NEOB|nr:unnamed protein product [Ranitomeya imitator]